MGEAHNDRPEIGGAPGAEPQPIGALDNPRNDAAIQVDERLSNAVVELKKRLDGSVAVILRIDKVIQGHVPQCRAVDVGSAAEEPMLVVGCHRECQQRVSIPVHRPIERNDCPEPARLPN